jgi:membrane protease YdiL (CAAX protease family)
MMLKQKTIYNWLWKLAIIFYCQFLLCQYFIEIKSLYKFEFISGKSQSLFYFIILFVFIPPLFEEFVFRGIFVKNKFKIFFSILFIVCTSYLAYNTQLNFWWVVPIIGSLIIFFNFKTTKQKWKNTLVIWSSIIFVLSHFDSQSSLLDVISNAGNYIAAALFLSWIVFNFGLFYSILIHFFYNLLLISFSVVLSNNVQIKGTNKDQIDYEIKKTSIFEQNGKINRTNKEFTTTNTNIQLLLNSINIPDNYKVFINNPILKYDMSIIKNNELLTDDEILDILMDAKVIQIR